MLHEWAADCGKIDRKWRARVWRGAKALALRLDTPLGLNTEDRLRRMNSPLSIYGVAAFQAPKG